MERMHHYSGFMPYTAVSMERMHHYWGFMSNTPVSVERMHHYWGFMSIHSSKYGKDASLLGLHVHTPQ